MLRNFGFPALAVAVLSMPAFAADLPSRVPAPVFVPPPAFVWSGVYIGATAGYAKAFHHYDDLQGAFLGYPGLADARSDGFALGGTLGINFQAGSFVYGIETDLSWLNNETTYVDPNGGINNFFPSETNKLNYLGTVRGRLGLAVDRTLIYFTAGLAYADVQNAVQYNSFRFPTSNVPFYNVDTTQFGWVVGAGVEGPELDDQGRGAVRGSRHGRLELDVSASRLSGLPPQRQLQPALGYVGGDHPRRRELQVRLAYAGAGDCAILSARVRRVSIAAARNAGLSAQVGGIRRRGPPTRADEHGGKRIRAMAVG